MAWYKHSLVRDTFIGVLLGAGFVVPALWPLGLVGIAWCVQLVLHVPLSIRSALALWRIWTVKSVVVLSFFWSVYPIDWLGFELGPFEPLVVLFYWVTVALWLGTGGLGFYSLVKLSQKYLRKYTMSVVPLLWLVAELFGALVFSLLTYGPGGSLNTHYSFGFMGYLLGYHEVLIQAARIAGVFGLTILIAALAVWLLRLYERSYIKTVVGLVLLLLVTSQVSVSAPSNVVSDTYTVASINTTFPNAARFTLVGQQMIKEQQQAALAAALASGANYVIFPEDARFFDQSDTAYLQAFLQFSYGQRDTVIVDSGRTPIGNHSALQAAIYDGKNNELYQAQKRYLVPQGEFMPYVYSGVLRLVGYSEPARFLEQQLSFRVGDLTAQSGFASHVPSVLFCFESNAPTGVRTLMQERGGDVPFIAHVVSHGWFHDPTVLWQQLEVMLRIQAIWNDVYIVSAGNHVAGYVVTNNGVVVQPTVIASGTNWNVTLSAVPIR